MIDQIKNNKLLLVIAGLLLGYGLLRPNFDNFFHPKADTVNVDTIKVEKPSDPTLLKACENVISALKEGSGNRSYDGVRLSSLYYDLGTLIALDGKDQVIKSTLEIREANKLTGSMARLNLAGKYPNLAEACNDLVVAAIGDDDVVLDENMRQKAVSIFMSLSWACLEGSK
jgi:hypothetical protein